MDWMNLMGQFGFGPGSNQDPAMRPVLGAAGPAAAGDIVPAPGAQIGTPALDSFSPGMLSMAPGMPTGGAATQDVSGMTGSWGAVQKPGATFDPMMLATVMGGLNMKQPQQQQQQQMPMMGGGAGGGANMRGLFSQFMPQVAPRQASRTSGLLDKVIGGL